jgi:hypothetical protein
MSRSMKTVAAVGGQGGAHAHGPLRVFRQGDAQLLGLLLDEGAGARGADRVSLRLKVTTPLAGW